MENNLKNRKQIQVEQQILYTLAQIIETCPQYTCAQHIAHFMRKKCDAKQPYQWANEVLLQKMENYYDELKADILANIEIIDY